ncbi:MAG: hypothetical protein AAFX65_10725 [Cyanobacteria bacterium J06638_7]
MSLADGAAGGLVVLCASPLLIGFEKAVVEPVARRLFRRGTARIIPHLARLLADTDQWMPAKIASSTPRELELWVLSRLEALTGEPWPDPAELEPFWTAYDPRINASKTA